MDKTAKERAYDTVRAYQSYTKNYKEKIKFLEQKLQDKTLSESARQGYSILLEICEIELKKTTQELRSLVKNGYLI